MHGVWGKALIVGRSIHWQADAGEFFVERDGVAVGHPRDVVADAEQFAVEGVAAFLVAFGQERELLLGLRADLPRLGMLAIVHQTGLEDIFERTIEL